MLTIGNAGFQVRYKTTASTTWTSVLVPAANTTYTSPATLLASTSYDVQIRVKCGTVYLPYSPTLVVVTTALLGSETRSSTTLTDRRFSQIFLNLCNSSTTLTVKSASLESAKICVKKHKQT